MCVSCLAIIQIVQISVEMSNFSLTNFLTSLFPVCRPATSNFCQFYLGQFYGPTFCLRVIVLHVYLPCIFGAPIYAQWRTAHFLIQSFQPFFFTPKNIHCAMQLKFINFGENVLLKGKTMIVKQAAKVLLNT